MCSIQQISRETIYLLLLKQPNQINPIFSICTIVLMSREWYGITIYDTVKHQSNQHKLFIIDTIYNAKRTILESADSNPIRHWCLKFRLSSWRYRHGSNCNLSYQKKKQQIKHHIYQQLIYGYESDRNQVTLNESDFNSQIHPQVLWYQDLRLHFPAAPPRTA